MSATKPVTPPSSMAYEEVLARVKALVPAIRERAPIAEALRRQPEETIQEIVNAGLVRLLTPIRWGGYELGFDAFVDSVIEIGKADGSAAWCYAFLNIHSWVLAYFPENAQRDVWGGSPDALLATSFVPAGRVTPVEGGYRLSGDWPWSSGVDHCQWNMLAALIPTTSPNRYPEPRIFLLPRSDYEIVDTWFVAGQKATGSKNVVVNDVFIPEHRTLRLADIREGHGPGSEVNTGPLYQIPLVGAFMAALASPILGVAVGAYETWRAVNRTRLTGFTREQVSAFSHQQIRLAESASEIESAQLLMHSSLDILHSGRALTMNDRVYNRRNYAYIGVLCRRAVDRLFDASGGSANYESNPMQRYWRDIHAMAAHIGLNYDAAAEDFGRNELGLLLNPNNPYF